MRVFPLAARGFVITLAVTLATTSGAQGDKPSVGELQVRLVESRQQLNGLYAQAAVAAERLNGATYELQQAQAAVDRQRLQMLRAKRSLRSQREAVAGMTVAQLQSGTSASTFLTMLTSAGPQQLLERASAYSSTNEAMTARMDALSARQVVYDASARQAREAVAAQRSAITRRKAARRAIHEAIARAESAVSSSRAERRGLLQQLAAAQGSDLAEVTRRQDQIDERLDQSGPNVPAVVTPPDTSDPKPSTPTPTQPTPAPPKAPPVEPPPASSSKVETAIAYARAQLGEPYVWGGAGPNSWDCSGLTMRAWQAAGISLPHYAGAQYTATKKVAVAGIRRGDLLYWSNGGAGSIYHEGLYLGGGQMIHAPRPGRNVEIVPLSYWIRPDLASRPG